MFTKYFWWTLGIILALDLISFFSSLDTRATTAVGIAFTIATLFIALRRPEHALLVVVAELVHGSQGHLFEIHIGNAELSIRMALFAALLVGWIINRRKFMFGTVGMWWYALVAAVAWGIARGLMSGNSPTAIFTDSNAYGYILLIFPALDIIRNGGEQFRRRTLDVILAAALATAVLTIAIHVIYRLNPIWLRTLYVWIRDWGLGEVTPPSAAGFNRVFFQSHLWALIGFLLLLSRRSHGLVYGTVAGGLLLATVFLSFSRSLWLGLIVGGLGLVAADYKRIIALLKMTLGTVLVAAVVVAIIAPGVFVRATGRVVGSVMYEPAAVSRWNLLPVLWSGIKINPVIGHGFGTTLTYQTKDPKLIQEFGTDQYTTAAFEWGYLEQWFKMGLLGLVALLGLLFGIGRRLLTFSDPLQRAGLLASLLAIAVIHATSPYLNHPLGLGYLVLADVFSRSSKNS